MFTEKQDRAIKVILVVGRVTRLYAQKRRGQVKNGDRVVKNEARGLGKKRAQDRSATGLKAGAIGFLNAGN